MYLNQKLFKILNLKSLVINTKFKLIEFDKEAYAEKFLKEDVYIYAENPDKVRKIAFNNLNGILRVSLIIENKEAFWQDYECKKVEPLVNHVWIK